MTLPARTIEDEKGCVMPPSPGNDEWRQDAAARFKAAVSELQDLLAALGPDQIEAVYQLAMAVAASWRNSGKLLICGNGGSAADAQHIAAELMGRFLAERPAYAAVALTTNSSTLTSVANDYGYEQIFARQIVGIGRPEDVLLVISTSGNSANCVQATAAAHRLGMRVFGFLGGDGGELRDLVDLALVVPSTVTPRIQEVHITMGHLLCGLLESWRIATGPAADGVSHG
jgi:D-sedoheptulose 7-phosphate isomerase